MAVASAGPHASLHLAPDREPCHHPNHSVFYRPDALLPPSQQRQSVEGRALVFRPITFLIFAVLVYNVATVDLTRRFKLLSVFTVTGTLSKCVCSTSEVTTLW